jgi:hypothetical protein
MSDEGTCRNPKMVEIVMYEDRDGGHRVEVKGNRGRGRIDFVLPMDERTPLSTTAQAVLPSMIAVVLDEGAADEPQLEAVPS